MTIKINKLNDLMDAPLLSLVIHSLQLTTASKLQAVCKSYKNKMPNQTELFEYTRVWSSDIFRNEDAYVEGCQCNACKSIVVDLDGVRYVLWNDSWELIFDDDNVSAYKLLMKKNQPIPVCAFQTIQSTEMWSKVLENYNTSAMVSIWLHQLNHHDTDAAFVMLDEMSKAGCDMQNLLIGILNHTEDEEDYDNLSTRVGNLCITDTVMVNHLTTWQVLTQLGSYYDIVMFQEHFDIWPLHELVRQYDAENSKEILEAVQRLFPDDREERNAVDEDGDTVLDIVFRQKQNVGLRQFFNRYKHNGSFFMVT